MLSPSYCSHNSTSIWIVFRMLLAKYYMGLNSHKMQARQAILVVAQARSNLAVLLTL